MRWNTRKKFQCVWLGFSKSKVSKSTTFVRLISTPFKKLNQTVNQLNVHCSRGRTVPPTGQHRQRYKYSTQSNYCSFAHFAKLLFVSWTTVHERLSDDRKTTVNDVRLVNVEHEFRILDDVDPKPQQETGQQNETKVWKIHNYTHSLIAQGSLTTPIDLLSLLYSNQTAVLLGFNLKL